MFPIIFYHYHRDSLPRYMTRRVATCLMACGWIAGFTIASIPVIWNKWEVCESYICIVLFNAKCN